MEKREILLITDSHLTERCPQWTVFRSMLEKISESKYDVLFLGDIFDVWIGFPGYETEIHRDFMEWSRREKVKRNIWFLEGNHEFFIKQNRSDCFTEVFSRSAVLDNGAFYAEHGDLINYHDHLFTLLRACLRNPLSRFLIKLFGYTGFGTAFSGRIRKDLKNTNMKQKHYFPLQELLETEELLRKKQISSAVMGHFHHGRREGIITVLEKFSPEDYMIGRYRSGTGVEVFPVSDLFGDLK